MSEDKTQKIKRLKLMANTIRQDIIKMLYHAKSGHTAGSLGMADVFSALYFEIARHNPKDANWQLRDKIILSNGHICPALYSALARSGYFDVKELDTLRKIDSRLQGHPHIGDLPAIENSSGPLGQGLSQACGIALANRLDKKDSVVFCLTSDGEHQEGQTWEAVMFASKYKLSNLIQIMDRNFIQIDGNTETIMPLEPLAKKYESFGWNFIEIDGNNMEQIVSTLERIVSDARKCEQQNDQKNSKERPTIVIAKTIAGKGFSLSNNQYKWHGKAPNFDEMKLAISELEKEREIIAHE